MSCAQRCYRSEAAGRVPARQAGPPFLPGPPSFPRPAERPVATHSGCQPERSHPTPALQPPASSQSDTQRQRPRRSRSPSLVPAPGQAGPGHCGACRAARVGARRAERGAVNPGLSGLFFLVAVCLFFFFFSFSGKFPLPAEAGTRRQLPQGAALPPQLTGSCLPPPSAALKSGQIDPAGGCF